MEDYPSLEHLQKDLQSGTISCVDLVSHYFAKIEANKDLNAFLEVFSESALEQAKKVDKRIQDGTAGRLFGMVIGLKDNLCYKNHRVSASSKILDGFESLFTATAVERLLNEDSIIIGRLNCDEFAMGSSNENSAFGPVKNAIQSDKVPGGSSGGSCTAVKAGLCFAALGTDTGGSIRQPAAFSGVVGFKPTYGRVSRHGLIAYASSFDQIGPITKSVKDAGLIYEIMAGMDEYDGTLSSRKVDSPSYSPSGKKKIAVIKDYLENEGVDSEIRSLLKQSISRLEADGHEISWVEFPYLDYMIPTYYVITTAEASSNLARFDGVHYGYRNPESHDVESTYKLSRSYGFGEEVKRRIMLGTFVLSSGYYDAYFTKGQKVRNLIREKTLEILQENDFILTPTTPTTAFKIGENADDPITMYLQDIFTVQANLAGTPAISLPYGEHSNGMPIGVQLMGNLFQEAELLSFSDYLMKN